MKIVRLNEAEDVIDATPMTHAEVMDDDDIIDAEVMDTDPDSEIAELKDLSFKWSKINNDLTLVPVINGQTLPAPVASPNEVQTLVASGGPPLFPPTQTTVDDGIPMLPYKAKGREIMVVPKAVSFWDIIKAKLESSDDDLFRQAYQKTMEIMNSNLVGRDGFTGRLLSLFGSEFDSIDDPFTKKIRQLGNKLADKISQWRSKVKNEALELLEADLVVRPQAEVDQNVQTQAADQTARTNTKRDSKDEQEEFMFYRQICKRIYIRLMIKFVNDLVTQMFGPQDGFDSNIAKQLTGEKSIKELTSEMLENQGFDQHVSQKFAEVTGGKIDRGNGVISDLDNKTRVRRGKKSTFNDTVLQNWLTPMQNAVDKALEAKGIAARDANGLPIVDVGAILTSSSGPDLARGELISFAQAWGVPNMTANSPITDLFISGKINVTTPPAEFLKLYNAAARGSSTTDYDDDDSETSTTSATADHRLDSYMTTLRQELRDNKSSDSLDRLLKQVNKLLTDTGNQEYKDLQREIQHRLGL